MASSTSDHCQLDGYFTWDNVKFRQWLSFCCNELIMEYSQSRLGFRLEGTGKRKLSLRNCEGSHFGGNFPETQLSCDINKDQVI